MARVDKGSHSFTCQCHPYSYIHTWNDPYLPLLPSCSVTTLWLVLISRPTDGKRLSWPGWLCEILWWFGPPKMITHATASTNWARRTVTSLVQLCHTAMCGRSENRRPPQDAPQTTARHCRPPQDRLKSCEATNLSLYE